MRIGREGLDNVLIVEEGDTAEAVIAKSMRWRCNQRYPGRHHCQFPREPSGYYTEKQIKTKLMQSEA